jgi:hypothetical protein
MNARIGANSMTNNKFRSFRGRESLALDDIHPAAGDAADPLEALARIIGRTAPHGDTAVAGLDWSANTGPNDQQNPHGRYTAPQPSPPASYQSGEAQERGYETQPAASSRYFSGLGAVFNGLRNDDGDYAGAGELKHGHEQTMPPSRPLPGFVAPSAVDYEADEPQHDVDQAYGADDYQEDPPVPRHRGGLILVVALLGLAVLGTAGAFGLRAMFVHSLLPTLLPIIKSSNDPNKIVPSAREDQASNSSQPGAARGGTAENPVTREEQPVKVEPRPAPPRVVNIIPVPPGPSPAPPEAVAPATGALPPATLGTAPPAAAAMAPVSAAPPPAVSAEPKKIHTVTMRADRPSNSGAATIASRTTGNGAVRRASPKRSTMASAPPAGGNAPLSIVPSIGRNAAPASGATYARAAIAPASDAPLSVVSTTPVTRTTANAPGGGYAVQLTSQRSGTDAKAAFQTLQAKFPNQLGGRKPILRRVDLGAKGVYYRALVGPFASMKEAAGMCSSLKAAGANCIVQRN